MLPTRLNIANYASDDHWVILCLRHATCPNFITFLTSGPGTFVKKESTSRDASKPVGCIGRAICKKISVKLIMYLAGRYS